MPSSLRSLWHQEFTWSLFVQVVLKGNSSLIVELEWTNVVVVSVFVDSLEGEVVVAFVDATDEAVDSNVGS